MLPLIETQVTRGGIILILWQLTLYAVLIGNWWPSLWQYFTRRGEGLPGNGLVAFVAQSGHLADVTMGMVLLPVTRHGALAAFFKLEPSTNFLFHMTQAYLLFVFVVAHGLSYAGWAALYNRAKDQFHYIYPVLNPTYLYEEVWPGGHSSLTVWRASLIFTGVAATLIMTAMLLTSFPAMRRRYFNLFYFTHLSGILATIIVCLHASTMFYCTAPGLAMWLLDWTLRGLELRQKADAHICSLGRGWFSLTVLLPSKRLSGARAIQSPLAHFHIHHSHSSRVELHPFTTTTYLADRSSSVEVDGKDHIPIRFLFREMESKGVERPLQPSASKRRQWTGRLAALVQTELSLETTFIRPDSAPMELDNSKTSASSSSDDEERSIGIIQSSSASSADNPSCETSLDKKNLAASITTSAKHNRGTSCPDGIGAHLSLRLEGPYFTAAKPTAYRTVVCLVAGTGISGAIAIAWAFDAQNRARLASDTSSPHWSRLVVVWTVREKDYVDIPEILQLQSKGLDFRIHQTGAGRVRPNIAAILAELCAGNGDESWTYICGPSGFVSTAERACMKIPGLRWCTAM
ncbi:Putative ferric reductase transmembrane component-like domain-containing protein [Septoria linicola]|uniref:Ferric reductase transmembrane component-like domain-containing protein n=1 Tax=Septoria linicola TaxID=215465 RepID=A0A9Q9EDM9_9PEZI|nr:putative ferric reductase transmembrane component-like domain-containing protein [Septoria linicola]USW47926.1 Putative ferric reductase transmembrane component-like domain-containing protein [Septoria linicola]